MILQNLTKAIREQNYYAVFLEFVIVILGVVIGFQINAWNEARIDRVGESLALGRIQQDIENNIRELDARIAFDRSRNAQHRVLVAAVTAGTLSPDDRDAFDTAFARFLFFSRPPVSQPAYEALEQSGGLALIRDAELVSALNALRSDLAWIESQQASFREGLSAFAPLWRPYVFHHPAADPRQTRVEVELSRLAADRQAVSAVVESARMHAIFADYIMTYTQGLRSICAELADMTGKPCSGEEIAP